MAMQLQDEYMQKRGRSKSEGQGRYLNSVLAADLVGIGVLPDCALWYNADMQLVTPVHIESRPEKCGGRPCISGTRIRVHDIYVWHVLDGLSPVEILGEKPELSLASIHAAISYVFDHREEIERELAEENAEYERLKQKASTKPITDGDTHQVPS